MSKKLVMLMFVVAATLFCSHQLVVAEEATIGAELSSSVSRPYSFPDCCDYDKWQIRKCMSKTACTDDCCPKFKRIFHCNCDCYRYANYFDKQTLNSLASKCGLKNPCQPAPRPPPPPPRPQPQPSCSATDKAKIKTCMTTTVSMDECCPTYKSTIGRSCACHQYAEQVNYQDVITIEAYCDVTSPCKKVQVIELPQ